MNGNVRINGSGITFNTVITTKRFCTRETAVVEQAVLSTLGKATRFAVVRDQLTLYSGRTRLAQFERKLVDVDESPAPNQADQLELQDRKWVLESTNGKNIPNMEHEAFINFDPAKESVGGDTGCNVFGGDYTVNGNSISITGVISTMRACIEDKRMEVERDMLEGLRLANRYTIRVDKLMLYRKDKLLLTFTGRKK
jgi:heat shock protein HslJ